MQVTELSADGLKHEFKVVVPSESIQKKVEDRLAEVGRTVRLPGFRPGKVPQGLLKKKYGQAVLGEVLEDIVNEGARKAIDEKKIRPAMHPKVEVTSFEDGSDLEFSVAVEALPDFAVMDLGSLSLERMVAPVSDEQIEEGLKNLAQRNGGTEALPADHAAGKGDIAVIDFLGKLDGVPFDGGKGEGFNLELGSNTFIPGFEDQLQGVKAGDTRVVTVTFPENYGAETLAGKAAEFDVTVHEVRAPKPAALDDELAKAVGLETLQELRDAFKAEIERDYGALSRTHLKRALLDALAAGHDFTVPEGMVESEFEGIWKQFEQERAQNHIDPSDAGKSDDELKAEYRRIAERRVRLGLVMAEIGRINNVTVTQEDLNRAVMNEARRFPGQERQVFEYFQKNQDALNNLRAPVFEEKVVDFILEMAKVADRTVTVEELRRDPDATDSGKAAEEAAPAKPKARKKKASAEEA
ncbi:MAG: trigger factor [Rhodospirillaceae bacterium]|nr:trigger factor [Rhodospirillaceae bacterium]